MNLVALIRGLLAALVSVVFVTAAMAQSAGPLEGKLFGSGNRALVVVLHGDLSRGGPANYHYSLASQIAAANKGVSVLALLRPGYSDGAGLRSKGSNNNRSDHYTQKNNLAVAQTIQAMAKQVGTSRVVAVGHSGGAAQIGGVLGLAPSLVQRAVLVSCPCDIATWRKSRGRSAWRQSEAQSPHLQIPRIANGTRITLVVGANDDNTTPQLSEAYLAAAKARGLRASLVKVAGAKHNMEAALQAAALKAVNAELK